MIKLFTLLLILIMFLMLKRGSALTLSGDCAITQEPLRNGNIVCKTNKGQYYHWTDENYEGGLRQWLENNTTDPMTREEIDWVREVPYDLVKERETVSDEELGSYLSMRNVNTNMMSEDLADWFNKYRFEDMLRQSENRIRQSDNRIRQIENRIRIMNLLLMVGIPLYLAMYVYHNSS